MVYQTFMSVTHISKQVEEKRETERQRDREKKKGKNKVKRIGKEKCPLVFPEPETPTP